jgi:anti-sigma factor RsiW
MIDNNSCPDNRELQKFSDGELEGPARSSVAQHVASCDRCASELRQLQRMGELVSYAIRRETEGHDLSGVRGKVLAGVRATPPAVRSWGIVFRLLWKPAARLAYAALVVLVAGFFAVKSLLPGRGAPKLASVGPDTEEVVPPLGQAHVDRVAVYDPDVTVSVLLARADDSAIVWITGLETVEEN